jgi:hypothetical protein
MAALLIVAAAARFENIRTMGMRWVAGDSYWYLKIAKRWVDGNIDLFGTFQPLAHVIGALAIRIWGYNDYSIKLAHAGMDTLTVAMIFLTGLMLTRSAWCALVPAFAYSFLPQVLTMIRDEMVHSPTSTFVIGSTVVFILYRRALVRNRSIRFTLLPLAAMLLSGAFHLHPLMALAAPPFVLTIILLHLERKPLRQGLTLGALDAAIYTLAYFAPFAFTAAYFGWDETLSVLTNRYDLQYERAEAPAEVLEDSRFGVFYLVLLRSVLRLTGSRIWLALFAASMVIAAWRVVRRRGDDPIVHLPALIVLSFAALYAAMFPGFNEQKARHFIPYLPFVFISIAHWIGVAAESVHCRM